jgi:hypothetical protein
MPRFYFDLENGKDLTPDDVGHEYFDLGSAERGAVTAAMEVGRSLCAERKVSAITVVIRDEYGQKAAAVTLIIDICRLEHLDTVH